MKLYSQNEHYKLYNGNMLDLLEVIDKETIDAVLTDPPYELNFMGKGWDNSGIAFNSETWKQCYEVLKPGGYLLAFGGSRTYHRIACAIEDAGFEIRDTIMWLYGSGFPKSMNIGLAIDKKNGVESEVVGNGKSGNTSKAFNLNEQQRKAGTGILAGEYEIKKATNKYNGWGTALKPSFEPIIVARKPFKGSCVDNVIKYGVGGINIDECRVGNEIITQLQKDMTVYHVNNLGAGNNTKMTGITTQTVGRFPANTILTYDETDFEEVCGGFPNTKGEIGRVGRKSAGNYEAASYKVGITTDYGIRDSGSASRYFYCAKASKKDRDEGLEEFEATTDNAKGNGLDRVCEYCGVSQLTPEKCLCETKSWVTKPKKNTHPTVKPTDLMQYLVRLVTPNGGTVLDPFNGSGSTGKAVMYENKERNKNYKYIGIELTEEYLPIARARIEYVCNLQKQDQTQQTDIFDFIDDLQN